MHPAIAGACAEWNHAITEQQTADRLAGQERSTAILLSQPEWNQKKESWTTRTKDMRRVAVDA